MRKRTYYNTQVKLSRGLGDYLELLENVTSETREKTLDDGTIKKKTTYTARCPLYHNHPLHDEHPSFIISEGDYTQPVIYKCRSFGGTKGKCSFSNLTNWFTKKFKEEKRVIEEKANWPNNSKLLNKINEELEKVIPYRNRLGGVK
jgi:SET domain-containing protein